MSDELQQMVGEWAERTFPRSTQDTVAHHLGREVEEFGAALDNHGRHGVDEELADCALLLLHLAHKRGVSLAGLVIQKHSINERRMWGLPDAQGVAEHVR